MQEKKEALVEDILPPVERGLRFLEGLTGDAFDLTEDVPVSERKKDDVFRSEMKK